MIEKRCPGCEKDKPVGEFYADRRTRDGKRVYCKRCCKDQAQRWQAANPERVQEATRRWQKANPDKARVAARRWRDENPEKVREANRRWQEANPEKKREANRRWRDENPDKQRAAERRWRDENPEKVRASIERRKARLRENGGSHTEAQWLALVSAYGNRCVKCGVHATLTREGNLEKDHVQPVALGGSADVLNLQPLCKSCNSSKGATEVDYRPDGGYAAFLLSVNPPERRKSAPERTTQNASKTV